MKKYITAFFTFVGYVTFLFAMGAGIVLYIGHRKALEKAQVETSAQLIEAPGLTPAKDKEPELTPMQFQPLSAPPQVSTRPRKSAKTATVSVRSRPTTTAKKSVSVSAPVTYAAPKEKRTIQAKTTKPQKVEKAKTKQPAATATTHADLGLPEQLHRTYRATDRATSPRTGGSRIPDVTAPPSELEKQAMRHAENIRQLEEETAKIRTPPVEETDLMKLLSGGEK